MKELMIQLYEKRLYASGLGDFDKIRIHLCSKNSDWRMHGYAWMSPF